MFRHPVQEPPRKPLSPRIAVELAAIDLQLKFLRLRLKAGFRPDQPRVPKGHRDGGQWTKVSATGADAVRRRQDAGRRDAEAGTDGRQGEREPARTALPAPRNQIARTAEPEGDALPAQADGLKPEDGKPDGELRRQVIRDETGNEPWIEREEFRRPDGTLAGQIVTGRDGSRVVSQKLEQLASGESIERHFISLADGSSFVFENAGATQRIFEGQGRQISEIVWTPNGLQMQAFVQPAFGEHKPETPQPPKYRNKLPKGRGRGQVIFEALILLYNYITGASQEDDSNSVSDLVVLDTEDFKESGVNDPSTWIGKRSREDVKNVCSKFTKVQEFTDEAVKETQRGEYKSAATYGTAIHTNVKEKIDAERDVNFRAEVSVQKYREEVGQVKEVPYGTKDSIRIDAYENKGNGVVCVYDIKTGKSGLSKKRFMEILTTAISLFGPLVRLLIVETRPTVPIR